MSAPSPLLNASRRKTVLLSIACGILVSVSVVWALRSPSPSASPVIAAPPPQPAASPFPSRAPLSPAAFAARLWTSPATVAEPPPPPPQTPAAPLKLQLLAIHTDSSPTGDPRFRAALFDPDTGRVHSVVPGDTISGRTVIAVEASRVILGPAAQPVSLLLRPGDLAR